MRKGTVVRIREWVGQLIFVGGLATIYTGGQVAGSFAEATPALAGGAVAVVVGYSIAGWHRPGR